MYPAPKRKFLIDKLFELRREYNTKRIEQIKYEEYTYKIPEITPQEANMFIKSGFVDEDPVVQRLLSKLGPLALVGKECAMSHKESTLHSFMKDVMNEHSIPVRPGTAKFTTLVQSLKNYDVMVRKQNEKNMLCFHMFTPEVCMEVALKAFEKSIELNKKEHLIQEAQAKLEKMEAMQQINYMIHEKSGEK